MFVWFDGKINPCDTDYKSELAAGNVKDESLEKIWQGDSYSQLRSNHETGNRSAINPCNRCVVV